MIVKAQPVNDFRRLDRDRILEQREKPVPREVKPGEVKVYAARTRDVAAQQRIKGSRRVSAQRKPVHVEEVLYVSVDGRRAVLSYVPEPDLLDPTRGVAPEDLEPIESAKKRSLVRDDLTILHYDDLPDDRDHDSNPMVRAPQEDASGFERASEVATDGGSGGSGGGTT